MLLWFKDLMNVTEEVTIHRPNVSTLPWGKWGGGRLQSNKQKEIGFRVKLHLQECYNAF